MAGRGWVSSIASMRNRSDRPGYTRCYKVVDFLNRESAAFFERRHGNNTARVYPSIAGYTCHGLLKFTSHLPNGSAVQTSRGRRPS